MTMLIKMAYFSSVINRSYLLKERFLSVNTCKIQTLGILWMVNIQKNIMLRLYLFVHLKNVTILTLENGLIQQNGTCRCGTMKKSKHAKIRSSRTLMKRKLKGYF